MRLPLALSVLLLQGTTALAPQASEPAQSADADHRAVPAPRRELPVFPILVWMQPKHLISYWKKLGFNTIVNGEKHTSESQRLAFLDACKEHDVFGVLAVEHFTPHLDAHPALLMWRMMDEPDLNPKKGPKGYVPRVSPKDLRKRLAKVPASRKKPLWLNTTVRFYRPYRQLEKELYRDYYELADVCGFDHYPVTGWNLPQRVSELDPATRACIALAGGRPVLPIVECSDQDLAWTPEETRGPTALEMRAEIALSLVAGARGIGYFSIAFNPFRWKNLTKEVEAELVRTNTQLQSLSHFLKTPPNPRHKVLSSDSDVQCALREVEGDGLLLVIVNRSRLRTRTTLWLRGLSEVPTSARRLEDGTDYKLEEGSFQVPLGPLEAAFFRM